VENKVRTRQLKKNSDFLELRRKGQKVRPSEWLQIHFLTSKQETLQVGITASRKVGTAVIRNKLKRWSREFFRKKVRAFPLLTGKLNVIFRAQAGEFYKELKHEELDAVLDKACRSLRTPS